LAWLLAGWLLLLALGYFVAPPLARSVLAAQLGKALGRDVAIERVAINPLNLSVDVMGLSVKDRAGAEQLGFAQLHIDLSSASVAQAGIVVDDIRLLAPRVAITRLADGRYDISDWLDRWASGAPTNSGPLPRFSLNNIQITDGQFVFVDRPKGVRHTATSVKFSLPFISSLPYKADVFVLPAFSAVVDGSPLALEGRSLPFTKSHTSALKIDLDKLDLAQLQAYWPSDLPLRLKSGQLATRLSLDFAHLPDGAPSLSLSGSAQLQGLALTDAAGKPWLGLESLDVHLEKSSPLQQRWLLAQLDLRGLRLGQDAPDAPLQVQTLSAWQVQADLQGHRIDAESLQGSGIKARMVRSADGTVAWLPVLGSSSSAAGAAPADKSSPPVWSGMLGRLSLDEVGLRFEDRTLSPVAVQELTHASLSAKQLDIHPEHENTLALNATLNQTGQIKASGSVQLQPLAVRLALETQALPLVPMQGYVAPYLNISIAQGLLSNKGTLDVRQPADKLLANYKGRLTLGQFRAVDQANSADFLRWKSLYFGDVDFQLEPARLNIGEIALSDFYSRLILNPQGRLNLADILRNPASPSADTPASTPSNAGKPAASTPTAAMPIQIAKVTLQNGRVDFSDRFVKPNYSATVTHLGGSVKGLSSAPDTLADLDLRGNYASNAPVQITARFNPLTEKKFLDLQAKISDIDMVDFSPYSGKYAGYNINKGKLSMDAIYKLQDRQLTAQNRLVIDQLTFGDKVESPDATQLPVQLAISLLKNNRGQIDIELPIAGSLDDPQFSIGGLIFKVIGNLFVKAVTAPFALLGSLFGDSQELSQLSFAPGRASLDEAAVQKLQTLSKAMREREGLNLEITASSDNTVDPEGLKRALLERAVLSEKRKDMSPSQRDNTPLSDMRLDSSEYPTYLTRVYQQAKFPKPRNVLGQTQALPVEDMEKLMLTNLSVGEEELRTLATRRAQVVQGWLVQQGQVPLSRIFLLPIQVNTTANVGTDTGHPRVNFSLR
jgi:outer membrane protein OmpA-like peptidoglycan-associated protein